MYPTQTHVSKRGHAPVFLHREKKCDKNIGVEKDSIWVVAVNCAKRLSVNLLELRHSDSGGFVQQVDKVLALVVGAGGCG